MTSTTLRLSENGARVALCRAGAGKPLVLLHGVGMSSGAWASQLDDLARDHDAIAPDLPGHGGSDRLQGGRALPDYVEWCAQVLRALDLGPVSLVGHSMGALIAGGVAVLHPELVSRVAMLNGVYKRDPDARAAVTARAACIRAGEIDHATPLARWFGAQTPHAAARETVAQMLAAVDGGGYGDAYTAFAHGDATYAEDLHRISCPLLAMTGSDDLNSTPAMSRSIAACATHGRAQIIDGHGHMMPVTAPDQVTAALRVWLKTPAVSPALVER